jgi:hypothetical protein
MCMLLVWLLVGFVIKTFDHNLLMLKRVRLESFDSWKPTKLGLAMM